MRGFLIAAVVLLLTNSCAAQPQLQPDYSMDKLLSARATLIQRYVLSDKVARGVAICGEQDLLNGDIHSYLTVYVYRDSVKDFLKDFLSFATEISPGGTYGIDGVPVEVEILNPPVKTGKGATPNEQPKPDNRTDFPTRKI